MSNKSKIAQRCNSMLGKTWMHNGKTFRFNDYELSDEYLVVITETDYFRNRVQDAMKFLNDCLRVADEPARPGRKKLEEKILRMSDTDVILKQSRIVKKGIETLIDMIENKRMTAMLTKQM